MDQPGKFELDTEQLGALPIINAFCDRLGLAELLRQHLPHDDTRLKLSPATAIGVVVRNLVLHREPVYALGEWAAPFDPTLLGLTDTDEVALLNDDRVGRVLTRLFDADRASLLTRLVLDAVEKFGIDLSRLHNDSTSIKFTGIYPGANGSARGEKATAKITRGHSKDFRPDLKQLVWILTVSGDGAVPIAYRVADGNTCDDTTHIDTWNHLVDLVGNGKFMYVADCKLATRENMDHIHRHRGRFVSVLPASRAEDTQFRDWIVDHNPLWTEACRRPGRRQDDPDQVWHTTPAPWPSAEGFRIVWVKSSAEIDYDARGPPRPHRPRHRRHRRPQPTAGLTQNPDQDPGRRRAGRRRRAPAGRRGPLDHRHRHRAGRRAVPAGETRPPRRRHPLPQDHPHPPPRPLHRRRTARRPRRRLRRNVPNHQQRSGTARSGTAYKWQPNLEKRHAQLEGTQLVAPIFLHDAARIEGLLCCHFMAMLIQALIERQIRNAMAERGLRQLSLYPDDRGCAAPTTARVLEIFGGLARHHLRHGDQYIKTFHPELTELQALVLDLLGIPRSAYTGT